MTKSVIDAYMDAQFNVISATLDKLHETNPTLMAIHPLEEIRTQYKGHRTLLPAMRLVSDIHQDKANHLLYDEPVSECVAVIYYGITAAYHVVISELRICYGKLLIDYPEETALNRRIGRSVYALTHINRGTSLIDLGQHITNLYELQKNFDQVGLVNAQPERRAEIQKLVKALWSIASYICAHA